MQYICSEYGAWGFQDRLYLVGGYQRLSLSWRQEHNGHLKHW
jgi:hypothetical protein